MKKKIKKKKQKKIYYVYAYKIIKYENTFNTIKDLAGFLNRPVSSVYASISRLKKLKKDFILVDNDGIKHEIINDKFIRTGVWY